MIRLFEFRDLDKIMNIWLEGNLEAHSFIDAEYWNKNFDSVKSVLPNAEVYVYEEAGEILGFIGMDAEYIAGIFVAAGHKGQGIGLLSGRGIQGPGANDRKRNRREGMPDGL